MKLKYKLQLKLYSFKRGILNLITWFPVIWNDRQWDEEYIYRILIKKLKLKEQFFYKQRIDKDATQEIVTQLREVIAALERLDKKDYLSAKDYIDANKGVVDYTSWNEDEDQLVKEDIALVFDTIKKNINKWWD